MPEAKGRPILVFATDREVMRWVEDELAEPEWTLYPAMRVADLVYALVGAPVPAPQLLVADFDAMSAAELLEAHAIREHGWHGAIVALGEVGGALRTSLQIAMVAPRPFARHSVRRLVGTVHCLQG